MTLLEALPDSYVFTDADVNAHWELFAKIMNEEDLTEEQQEFYNVIDDAGRLRCKLKRMPSMGELKQYWREEDAKKNS
jgi:hypothetical protein